MKPDCQPPHDTDGDHQRCWSLLLNSRSLGLTQQVPECHNHSRQAPYIHSHLRSPNLYRHLHILTPSLQHSSSYHCQYRQWRHNTVNSCPSKVILFIHAGKECRTFGHHTKNPTQKLRSQRYRQTCNAYDAPSRAIVFFIKTQNPIKMFRMHNMVWIFTVKLKVFNMNFVIFLLSLIFKQDVE